MFTLFTRESPHLYRRGTILGWLPWTQTLLTSTFLASLSSRLVLTHECWPAECYRPNKYSLFWETYVWILPCSSLTVYVWATGPEMYATCARSLCENRVCCIVKSDTCNLHEWPNVTVEVYGMILTVWKYCLQECTLSLYTSLGHRRRFSHHGTRTCVLC